MPRVKSVVVLCAVAVAMMIVSPVFARGTDDTNNNRDTVQEDDSSRESLRKANDQDEDDLGRRNDDDTKVPILENEDEVRSGSSNRTKAPRPLRQKLDELRSEPKEILKDQRLARCQNREARINGLIDKAVVGSEQRYQELQKYESNIRSFYTSNSLRSDGYQAAADRAAEGSNTVEALLDTLKSQDFDCTGVDSDTPSAEIKLMNRSRRDAMMSYRDAIKDLFRVVKIAVEQQ